MILTTISNINNFGFKTLNILHLNKTITTKSFFVKYSILLIILAGILLTGRFIISKTFELGFENIGFEFYIHSKDFYGILTLIAIAVFLIFIAQRLYYLKKPRYLALVWLAVLVAGAFVYHEYCTWIWFHDNFVLYPFCVVFFLLTAIILFKKSDITGMLPFVKKFLLGLWLMVLTLFQCYLFIIFNIDIFIF